MGPDDTFDGTEQPDQTQQPTTLGFGQRLGMGMLQGIAQSSPLGNAVYNVFKPPQPPTAGPYARYQSPATPQMPAPPQAPVAPPVDETTGGGFGNNQWSTPAPKPGSQAGGMDGLATLAAGSGAIVTSPTIAKIGERGPEAIVPLTPRAGNKLQPDMLEGHIAGPRVPGVRYSRYKSANRFAPGAGGAIT